MRITPGGAFKKVSPRHLPAGLTAVPGINSIQYRGLL